MLPHKKQNMFNPQKSVILTKMQAHFCIFFWGMFKVFCVVAKQGLAFFSVCNLVLRTLFLFLRRFSAFYFHAILIAIYFNILKQMRI